MLGNIGCIRLIIHGSELIFHTVVLLVVGCTKEDKSDLLLSPSCQSLDSGRCQTKRIEDHHVGLQTEGKEILEL